MTPTVSATPDLAARLRLVVTRLSRRLRQHGESDVSPTQIAVLSTVERHGPLTPGALAAHERVQPPTATAAVTRLEEAGLVRRLPDPTDGRSKLVEVTPDGRALLARNRRRAGEYLGRRLRELSDGERRCLERAAVILERIIEEPGAGARP